MLLKLTVNSPFYTHTKLLFETLNILPVSQLFDFSLANKHKNNMKQNNDILNKIANLEKVGRINSNHCSHVWHVPLSKTDIKKQMLKCALPSLLNELLQDKMGIFSLTKNEIKRMLIECA